MTAGDTPLYWVVFSVAWGLRALIRHLERRWEPAVYTGQPAADRAADGCLNAIINVGVVVLFLVAVAETVEAFRLLEVSPP